MPEAGRRPVRALVLAGFLLSAPAGAAGQGPTVPIGDPLEDYLRVLEVAGLSGALGITVRPVARDRALSALPPRHPWAARYAPPPPPADGPAVRPLDIHARGFWNSAHPVDRNDGPVWQGKGGAAVLSAGAFARVGPVSLTLRPAAVWQQNADFALVRQRDPERPPFTNPWHPLDGPEPRIDRPQRFGPDPFWTFDPGQSALRVSVGGFAAGAATENHWWGPGIRNAIVLSNHAQGFPHAFVGTWRPVDVGVGQLQVRWLWGRLQESDWFDTIPDNDDGYFTGLAGSWAPSFVPGLTVGGTRAFVRDIPAGGLPFSEYFLVVQGITKASQQTPDNPTGDDVRDQVLSLFGRWVFPASGVEVYGEWARNDHAQDLRDFVLQPEHSQAWTLGLQKTFPLSGGRILRVLGETTRLQRPFTVIDRPTPPFYVHGRVHRGYTHRGQVLGAALGPGGNGQYLGADVFTTWGRVGGFVLREVHDNDAYYAQRLRDELSFRQNDVEISLGATAHVFLPMVDLTGTLAWGRELNRYYMADNDESNLHLDVAVRWRPGR